VTEIENWNGDNSEVLVHTEDGSIYEADFVILTFSLGVLQSEKVLFNPPLPKWKTNAIHKFGFAQYIILYLKFDTTFWDDTQTILYVPDRRGFFTAWLNMNTLFAGSNILQVSMIGSEAKAANRMSDDELVSEAVKVLRNMYPNETVPEPRNFTTSRWLSDPLTMGSYSYWTPAFTLEDMDNLMLQTGNLYYAGEHLNKTNHGYVHSAYTSGINTALDLITCIEDASKCNGLHNRKYAVDHSKDCEY
jgi:polyamine oxidase